MSAPCASHCFISCCRIHSPVIFCRNLMCPPTQPSLVKPACRASSVRMGRSSSTPSSDHVPELRKAQREVRPAGKGTAKRAAAVSCEPTAMTSVSSGRPNSAATSGNTLPRDVPGRTMRPNRCRGSPRRSMSAQFHVRCEASSSSEVEAMQYSLSALPVRK